MPTPNSNDEECGMNVGNNTLAYLGSSFIVWMAHGVLLRGRGHARLLWPHGGRVILAPPEGGMRLGPLIGGGAIGQGLFQTLGIVKTILWLLGQTPENNAFEIGGYLCLILR